MCRIASRFFVLQTVIDVITRIGRLWVLGAKAKHARFRFVGKGTGNGVSCNRLRFRSQRTTTHYSYNLTRTPPTPGGSRKPLNADRTGEYRLGCLDAYYTDLNEWLWARVDSLDTFFDPLLKGADRKTATTLGGRARLFCLSCNYFGKHPRRNHAPPALLRLPFHPGRCVHTRMKAYNRDPTS